MTRAVVLIHGLDSKLTTKLALLMSEGDDVALSLIQLLGEGADASLVVNLGLLILLSSSPGIRALDKVMGLHVLRVDDIHCLLQIIVFLEVLCEVDLILSSPNGALETTTGEVVREMLEDRICGTKKRHHGREVAVRDELMGNSRSEKLGNMLDV